MGSVRVKASVSHPRVMMVIVVIAKRSKVVRAQLVLCQRENVGELFHLVIPAAHYAQRESWPVSLLLPWLSH